MVKSVLDPDRNRIPRYEALSYAWGSPIPPKYINVTKKGTIERISLTRTQRLSVTQNLAEALRYLRFQDKPRVIWIDAICVDQRNQKERSCQVQRMADIYRNAERVLVWIGPARYDSALAIETLSTLSSRIEVDWNLYEMKSGAGEDSHWADREVALLYSNETWTSIHQLLGRPWFKRLWIWQEVLLASTVEMYCGYERLDWSCFRGAIFCIHQKDISYYVDPKTWKDFSDILGHLYCLITKSADPNSLQWLLKDTKGCECSDHRDRIYALLNLSVKSPGLAGLQPDYTQEPRDIYQEVVLRHLTHEGKLDLLIHCEWHGDITNKPTWVPNWSKSRIGTLNDFARACLGSRAKAELVENRVLKVTGLYCTEISDIGRNSLDDMALFSASDRDVIRMVESLAEHVNFSAPYVDGSDITEAFCRTLCMNDFSDNFVPVSSADPDFDISLRYLRSLLRGPSSQIKPYNNFLDLVGSHLKGRHLFTTEEGYIGVAPEAVKIGDQVCVILGCESPLLLRLQENGMYVVIGECYIHGLMSGEALLGPLPIEWRCAKIYVDGEGYYFGFVNRQTGDQVFEDPRLGQLPPGWRLKDQERRADWNNWFVNDETGEEFEWPDDPRMTAEALSAKGVPLQEFLLE